jgi:hypothetical protein
MRNLKIGDLVGLPDGAGCLGTVLDAVDGCRVGSWSTGTRRRTLVSIPGSKCEEYLAFAQADGGSAENPGRAMRV